MKKYLKLAFTTIIVSVIAIILTHTIALLSVSAEGFLSVFIFAFLGLIVGNHSSITTLSKLKAVLMLFPASSFLSAFGILLGNSMMARGETFTEVVNTPILFVIPLFLSFYFSIPFTLMLVRSEKRIVSEARV